MTVLVERLSVLVRERRLAERLHAWPDLAERLAPGGWCADGRLVRLAFADLARADVATRLLSRLGLHRDGGGEPGDVALVDERWGAAGWWPWLELARVEGPGGPALAAREAGDGRREVAVPAGWSRAGPATDARWTCRLRLADRPLRHLRREAGADVYLDRFTGEEVRLARSCEPAEVAVEARGGTGGRVRAELATTGPEIEVGLMFREALPPGAGMLFLFSRAEPRSFWMKNTLVPLDLVFVDAAWRVVNVVARAAPLTLAPRRSAGPARQVLEVAGGWAAAHGVGAGDRVRLEAPGEARP